MRLASLMGITVVLAAISGCSDEVDIQGSSSTTTTSGTGQGGNGAGGGTTMTTSSGTGGGGGMGQGGMGQGGSGQGGAGGSVTCDPPAAEPCFVCLYAECTDSYCTCANNPECLTLVACVQGCQGDQPCQQTCASDHPAAVADGVVLGDCASQRCAAECPDTGIELTPCEECIFTNCSSQITTCFANPTCQAAVECALQCGNNLVCVNGCVTGNPQAQAVLQCVLGQCLAQCQ